MTLKQKIRAISPNGEYYFKKHKNQTSVTFARDFTWATTPQGRKFWGRISDKIKGIKR